KDGNDLLITINQKVKPLLKDVLPAAENSPKPERATATIIDPKTGEIVAMSNRPTYDHNHTEDEANRYNDIISTPVEPATPVKMFTWAAAIDAGVYNGSDTYKSGKYQVNPRIQAIRDHNGGKGWGTISYDEGFIRSSNVAAAKIAWEAL